MKRGDPTHVTRRNFWLNVTEGAFFNAGFAFMAPTTLLPLFVASITSSRLAIGLANALLMLGLGGAQLLSAWWTRRTPRFWPWFVLSNTLCRIAVIPLVLVPFLPPAWRLGGFFAALLMFSISWGIAAATWGDFIGRLLPADRRGEFFGWQGSLQGPASMIATLAAALILSTLQAPWSFSACFLSAFVLMSMSLGCMVQTRYDGQHEEAEVASDPFWGSLLLKLRERPVFLRYALLRLVLAGGTVGNSFYVVAAQERFRLSPGFSTLLGLALLALPTLTGVWWGRLGDRKGPFAHIIAAIAVGATSNLLLILPGPLPLYVLGILLVGITARLLLMADYAFIYQNCPDERATYLGLFSFLQLPALLGFPLLAGAMADRFGIPWVFGGAAIAWMAGGIALHLNWPRYGLSSKFTADPAKSLF